MTMLTSLYVLLTILHFIEEKNVEYMHIDIKKIYKNLLKNLNIYKIHIIR